MSGPWYVKSIPNCVVGLDQPAAAAGNQVQEPGPAGRGHRRHQPRLAEEKMCSDR